MLDACKRSSENKCGILLPLFLIWLIKVAISSFTRFLSLRSLKNGPRFSCLCAKKNTSNTQQPSAGLYNFNCFCFVFYLKEKRSTACFNSFFGLLVSVSFNIPFFDAKNSKKI